MHAQADIERYDEIARQVLPFVGDTISLVNDAYDQGKRILVEGANATMLDVRCAFFPGMYADNTVHPA